MNREEKMQGLADYLHNLATSTDDEDAEILRRWADEVEAARQQAARGEPESEPELKHDLSAMCAACGKSYGEHNYDDCLNGRTTFRLATPPSQRPAEAAQEVTDEQIDAAGKVLWPNLWMWRNDPQRPTVRAMLEAALNAGGGGTQQQGEDAAAWNRRTPPPAAPLSEGEIARIRQEARELAIEECAGLREMSKSAWRAMCDAERVIRTIDPESAAQGEQLRQLATALSDIALSLFTLLREPTQEWACAIGNSDKSQISAFPLSTEDRG